MATRRVLGVRHHSPACARLVERVLREVRPACVLIEGPSDFNGRLDELLLGHQLPLAVFSFQKGECAAWTPFCAYSPEWVALTVGRELGAEVRFMDLPAWHRSMRERTNRYADRREPGQDQLARELGFDDPDSLWDHLFEHPGDDLEDRLRRYFQTIRTSVSPEDAEREAYMAACLGWARHTYEDRVVAVCGGYHAPFLEHALPRPEWPELEPASDTGSYLVPFSFHRLDSFQGYDAGMPSPGYYQHVWEAGAGEAARRALHDVTHRLRDKKLALSSADLVAASTLSHGLARLRGHDFPMRTDLLDGLVGALVKEALQSELPWSRRGMLEPGTDPVLVELVAAFSGQRVGKLAGGTPRPPLVDEVLAGLEALDLKPTRPARQVTVEVGTQRSYFLRRLALLRLPGFTLKAEQLVEETWTLQESSDLEAALVEASAYGSDLEQAAIGVLRQALSGEPDAAGLAACLALAVRAGLSELGRELVQEVARALGAEVDLELLGGALQTLFGLYRQKLAPDFPPILEAGFARGLWLFEGLDGATPGIVKAVVTLRDMHKLGRELKLARELAEGVMRRRLKDAPRVCQGAALGYLWSLELVPGEEEAEQAVRALHPPEALGDFLAGLFALAREEVQRAEGLLRLVDQLLKGLDRTDFLRALPGLRLAFSAFPPRERQAVAAIVARLYGLESTFELLRNAVDPALVAAGMQLDAELERTIERYGL